VDEIWSAELVICEAIWNVVCRGWGTGLGQEFVIACVIALAMDSVMEPSGTESGIFREIARKRNQ
jgi:hypothetical protein